MEATVWLTAQECKVWLFYVRSQQRLALSANILREICEYLSVRKKIPCINGDKLRLYDLVSLSSTSHSLSVLMSMRWVHCFFRNNQFLSVRDAPHTQTYEINLDSVTVTPAGNLHNGRDWPGLIWVKNWIYAFGGQSKRVARKCEKYEISGKRWSDLSDCKYEKACFMPCMYHTEVYLCCSSKAGSPFEAFHPIQETFRDLPMQYQNGIYGSVTFLVDETLWTILYDGNLLQWSPKNNVSKEQSIDILKDKDSAYSNISPVQVGDSVYWVNYFTGSLVTLELSTLSLRPELASLQ